MGRPIVRIGMAVGIALLALSALGMGPPTSSPGGMGDRGLPVCFWGEQGLVCVERTRADELAGTRVTSESLLAMLLAGPTAEERARGLRSAVPRGTRLAGVEVVGRAFTVRLVLPAEPLARLDGMTVEEIVEQVAATLEPLGWRDLRVEALDPATHEFRPLADFLPPLPAPRKETLLSGEERPSPRRGGVLQGQPPAPGQGQPQGALSGKTIYVSAGHGWQWNGYAWRTQRPPYPNPPYVGPVIEDHNNAEAVNQYLLQYLWNAGATVLPVRERDMNEAEVVVDNDDPGPDAAYFETGVWMTTTASGTGYAGTDYRWSETVTGTPTATAVWSAAVPADGRYAVYVWYRPGTNRAPDARYTVHHAGGETIVRVDQTHHGLTWHYIGTYGFRAADGARITLDNQSSSAGRAVIADAVRIGGGTFDDLTGIETAAPYPPDKPWWEVAAYYYTQRQGLDPDDWPYFNDVVARPMYARWEHAGTGDDAVYISWHTNGYSGYQWDYSGTVSYIHNGAGKPVTEGSADLRNAVHDELVHDIRAGWDAGWVDWGKRSKNLGELRELWDDDDPMARMPGALIEVAYHDHPDDTDALKDPRFNQLAARAIYQGIVKYFEQRDGVDLPLLPEPPTHLRVVNVGTGQVAVHWQPSPTDTVGLVGDVATGYRVYTSTDGLGWSNGIPVAGTAYTLTGLSPGQLLFVRVSATNDGGESFPTETLAARVGDGVGILLVNGFDRLSNTMLVPDYDPVEGYNMRMFLDQMNSYDYVVQHGSVINYAFDSAANEVVEDGLLSLGDYQIVDWILGEESSSDETLSAAERSALTAHLDGGGALFISGSELGWDLDDQGRDPAFYNTYLRADYAGDDADTYEVAPVAGSIFDGDGLGSFRFDAPGEYDADYPDQLTPVNGSTAALTYSGGLEGTAAVQYADGCQRLVYFGFPFETIRPEARADVMARLLDFLDECLALPVNTEIVTPTYGSAHNTVPPFEGTAETYTATVQRVEVQVERANDGYYWTGSDWVTETTWVTATGTLVWSYPLPALSDGNYRLRARACTTDEVDLSPAEVVFTYDTISPTSTALITPTGGVTIPAVTGVALTWEPIAPDGGSDLAYVVELDGQPYMTTRSVYTVTQLADGMHSWQVQVFDMAGNRSGWVTDTFYVTRYRFWLPLVMRDFEQGGGCTDVLTNGGFETDEGWVLNRLAIYDTEQVHSGLRSVRVGILPGEPGSYTYSSVAQTFALPAGVTATLSLWVYPIGEGNDSDDWHYISLYDQAGNYHAVDVWQSDARDWEQRQYDLSTYLGQTVTLYIGTRNDGDDDTAALYVDDVVLEVYP